MHVTVLRGQQRDRVPNSNWPRNSNPSNTAFSASCPCGPANKTGVTVRYVYPESPAAAAGIAAGDAIVSLQGEPITSRIELSQSSARWSRRRRSRSKSAGPATCGS